MPAYCIRLRAALFVIVLALLAQLLPAPAAQAQPQRLKTKEIFVFPNNMAFVFKEGALRFKDRTAILDEVPDAVYGTLWFYPVGNFKIQKTVFAEDTIYLHQEARSFFDMLKANVGKKAEVTYKVGTEIIEITGEVLPFMASADLAMIRLGNGNTIMVHRNQLEQVAIIGAVNTRYWDKRLGRATLVTIDQELTQANFHMYYFQTGFSWLPSYSIKLVSDTLARFTMRALVDNKGEDLDNANVMLVKGTPPLFYENQTGAGDATGVANDLKASAGRIKKLASDSAAAAVPASPAAAQADYLVYDGGTVSMKKNSTAYLTIIDQFLKYTYYEFSEVPDFKDVIVDNNFNMERLLPVQKAIGLENKLDYRLIPGPLFVLDADGHPLTQNLLPDMERGKESVLKLGESTTADAQLSEKIEKLETKVKGKNKDDKATYDKYTIKGRILYTNRTNKPISVKVVKDLTGHLVGGGGARVEKTGPGDIANQQLRLVYAGTIAPKGKAEFRYVYEIYK